KQDAFDAIARVIPWGRFRATVAEAEALARSEEFDAYQMLGEHYAGIRRWAPTFLDAFVFQRAPAAAPLMRAIDRRYYELCVLSELRDRLRAGDVWVVGSRRYRSFEERLISRETLQELEGSGTLPIAVDPDFDRFIADRRALLDERLAA